MSCTTLIGHSRPDSFRPSALHVLVADDHEMVRAALKHALAPLAAEIVWREASDAQGTEAALSLRGMLDLAWSTCTCRAAVSTGSPDCTYAFLRFR